MGKKIGILSMQRVINYGSFLQAYALKQLLLNAGADSVDFIDIIPGKQLVGRKALTPKWKRYLSKLIGLIKSGKLISGLKDFAFNRKLEASIINSWDLLGLNELRNHKFDIVVIGSDEVFNCCQDCSWGYSTQLFGDIPKDVSEKVISYAASFGYTNLEDLKKFNIDEEIAHNLKTLSAISVRDRNSQNIVKQLTGIEPPIHLDPVLIYGYQQEIEAMTESPMDEPYMVVYSYQGRISDEIEIKAITEYAKKNDLRLIGIFCRYDWCDEAILPENPIEVLRWFKYAQCIVTDTFHGTIFSIITHSRFATIIRPSNRNKLHHLLYLLGLTNHEFDDTKALSTILKICPDYTTTESLLEVWRNKAKTYIETTLLL